MIINFSNILPENPNVYTFNPSLTHWKDDLYLCVYRRFVRYPELYQKSTMYDYTDKGFANDINHPWFGGVNSIFWFKSLYGFDNTGIVLLKINNDNNEVVLYKDFNTTNAYYTNGIQITTPGELIKGVDARLAKIKENKFIISYNNWIIDNTLILKDNKDCGEGCGLIETCIIELEENLGDVYLIAYPPVVICPEISNRLEKNWSFWNYNDEIFFSYGIYKNHDVYQVEIEFNNTLSCKLPSKYLKTKFNETTSCFEKLRDQCTYNYVDEYGNLTNKSLIHVSVTTPSINYISDYIYIGVGHIKYEYSKTIPVNSSNLCNKLYQFTKSLEFSSKKNAHPFYIYLMFIYTFNAKTGKILKISDMFIPYNESMLCFPSGITKTNNNEFLISYGVSDASCYYLKATREDIDNILHNASDSKCFENIKFLYDFDTVKY